jgi:UDP-N-acetylglucosamine--N-acetylmuramyl-(pentapeptide) pyrophosphoryl-undecaprenol N-acetylglucosamine transferase
VLIPLPGAPGDHQTKNAQALVDHQAGIMLRDGDLNGATLNATLERLLNDKDRRASMEQAARQLGHPDAANEVASVVLGHG